MRNLDVTNGGPLFDAIDDVLVPIGLRLVELTLPHSVRPGRQVMITVCRTDATIAVSTEDCERVFRAIDAAGVTRADGGAPAELVVLSPGIDRVLRNARELQLFTACPVCVRLADATEIVGLLDGVSDADGAAVVTLRISDRDGTRRLCVPVSDITRAKLTYQRLTEVD